MRSSVTSWEEASAGVLVQHKDSYATHCCHLVGVRDVIKSSNFVFRWVVCCESQTLLTESLRGS